MRVEIKSEKEVNAIRKEPTRIVMNAEFFYTTIKYMQKLVKENPDAPKFVLEYNPNTKELFTDVTEANEETNVS